MFQIDISRLYWINNVADDPEDLCLHGHVIVTIGEEIFETDATISATALYLLKTLTENHIIYEDNQMLPCCGHFFIPNKELDNVSISGCPNGVDWSVIHVGDTVKIVTEAGRETLINLDKYRKEVYAFVDEIESYYRKCATKKLPVDEFDRDGYIAFWNEWHRRRK